MNRARVLLVGVDAPDTPIDSFRRLLQPFYDVDVFDPFRSVGRLSQIAMRWQPRVAGAVIANAANAIYGDPIAFNLGALKRAAEVHRPDYVFVSCITELAPDVVRDLRRSGPSTCVIGFFSDALINLGRAPFIAAPYDALFLKDPYLVRKLRAKLGWTHCFYLPEGCDPSLHRSVKLSPADWERFGCDLSIAGNMHYFRAAELRPLIGKDLKIWGIPPRSWFRHPIMAHHQRQYVQGEEKCRAMLASKIVLNPNHFAEIEGVNQRTFELAAIGAFQLTDTPGLRDVFEPNVEVATFDTQAEMLERIEYYLAQPRLRKEMARRAQVRAHGEHTFAHRWVAMLEAMGGSPPVGFPVSASALTVRARNGLE